MKKVELLERVTYVLVNIKTGALAYDAFGPTPRHVWESVTERELLGSGHTKESLRKAGWRTQLVRLHGQVGAMSENISWFHVFDATNGLWLQYDERSWGEYDGAAEFASLELARDVALREIRRQGPNYDAVVTILGDFGAPEL